MTDDLQAFSVNEVRERLDLSKSVVLGLLHSGELHAFRVGRVWRIPASELADFMRRRTAETPPCKPKKD